MSFRLLLTIIFLLTSVTLFAQCNDSVVVEHYTEDNSFNPSFQEYIQINNYHLDSGSVSTSTLNYASPGNWTTAPTSVALYNRTDTILNASGLLSGLFSYNGNGNGWTPSTSIYYYYNNLNNKINESKLQWNGTGWDSLTLQTWSYDSLNRLTDNSTFQMTQNVWIKKNKIIISYSNGAPSNKIIQIGDSTNSWSNYFQYQFYYTNNLRTSVETFKPDSTGNWVSNNVYNYFLSSYNQWVFQITDTIPVIVSGNPLLDSSINQIDTFENIVFHSYWQYTSSSLPYAHAIYTTSAFELINSILVYLYSSYAQMTNDWSFPAFDQIDRTGDYYYTYDSIPRVLHITANGACTNPCGTDYDYTYDIYGRTLNYEKDHWTMVDDDDLIEKYIYFDSIGIKIIVPPYMNNFISCINDTIHPILSVASACNNYHIKWSPATGLSSDTILSPLITVSGMTIYTVVASNDFGISDTTYITVSPLISNPQISIDTINCDGSELISVGITPATFNWHYNTDSNIVNNTHQFLAMNPGNYWCAGRIYNYSQTFSCPYNSDTIAVTSPLTPVLVNLNDTLYCLSPAVQYNWYNDSSLIATTTDSFFVATGLGDYSVDITDSNGCVYSSSSISSGIENIGNHLAVKLMQSAEKLSVEVLNYQNEYHLFIKDILGNTVFETIQNSNTTTVDLTNFSKGIYILTVVNKSSSLSKKFVRQ